MATSGGTASQRDRSRDRSPSRPASGRQAPGVQGAESDRLDRLEPGMQPVNPTPCPGTPAGFPNAQELAPGATQNMPTTTQGVNPNANIPVDPLQTQDPWRNFQTPSQEAGIPDRPFPVSMPTSPDRQKPFGATSSNAQAASPPAPGLPGP